MFTHRGEAQARRYRIGLIHAGDCWRPSPAFSNTKYALWIAGRQRTTSVSSRLDVTGAKDAPLLLFLVPRIKCVLKSPSQFVITVVSRSGHLAKTASALATHGMRRGGPDASSLQHKLLFQALVLCFWEVPAAIKSFLVWAQRKGFI
jgi:hypothetical protein